MGLIFAQNLTTFNQEKINLCHFADSLITLRTNEAENSEKIKNSQPQPKFTGSCKKKCNEIATPFSKILCESLQKLWQTLCCLNLNPIYHSSHNKVFKLIHRQYHPENKSKPVVL